MKVQYNHQLQIRLQYGAILHQDMHNEGINLLANQCVINDSMPSCGKVSDQAPSLLESIPKSMHISPNASKRKLKSTPVEECKNYQEAFKASSKVGLDVIGLQYNHALRHDPNLELKEKICSLRHLQIK